MTDAATTIGRTTPLRLTGGGTARRAMRFGFALIRAARALRRRQEPDAADLLVLNIPALRR